MVDKLKFSQGKISLYLLRGRFSGFLASSIDIPGFFLYNSCNKRQLDITHYLCSILHAKH